VLTERLFRDVLFPAAPYRRLHLRDLTGDSGAEGGTGGSTLTRGSRRRLWQDLAREDPRAQALAAQIACLRMEDYLVKAAVVREQEGGGAQARSTKKAALAQPWQALNISDYRRLHEATEPLDLFAERWLRGQAQSRLTDWARTREHVAGLFHLLRWGVGGAGGFTQAHVPFPVTVLVTLQSEEQLGQRNFEHDSVLGLVQITHELRPSARERALRELLRTHSLVSTKFWSRVYPGQVFHVHRDPALTREAFEPDAGEVAQHVEQIVALHRARRAAAEEAGRGVAPRA
jgi:hypothetical protein